MTLRKSLDHFDWPLFIACLGLSLLGLLGLSSASLQSLSAGAFLRQMLWIGLGVTACFVVLGFDYHFLTDNAMVLYVLSVLLLVAILFFGTEINGSKSWLRFGGVGVQPSELVKLVVILALTRYLSGLNENYLRADHVIKLTVMTVIPAMLVILQGDLGTALMYFPILAGMMVVAGMKARFVVLVLLSTLAVTPATWLALKDYQKERILIILDSDRDPKGIGYQTRQSKIAIGSGGVLGTGLGNGLQSQLGFVPEIRTDFIFALLAEETGLLGACVVLMLYLFVLSRMVRIAEQAKDRTGILILTGIASLIFCHVITNIGMTLGVLPPIGIPLPLLSYGGSSTITTYVAIGLALNVHSRRFFC